MKKKIRTILYIMVVLWIGVFTQAGVRYFFQDEERIMDAFANTNSNIIESKVELVADYGTRFLSTEDKKDLIQYIFNGLGVNDEYTTTEERGKKSSEMKAIKKSKNSEVSVEIITMEKQKEEEGTETKQYILVDLSIFSNCDSILKYKNILEKIIKNIEIKSFQSVIKIDGVYTGKLTLEEKSNVTNKLLENLQAKSIREHRDNELFVVTGYTGLVPEYIVQEGKRTNINIIINYDENKDKTNICLASPILNGDY